MISLSNKLGRNAMEIFPIKSPQTPHKMIEWHQRNLEPRSEPRRSGVRTPSEVALDLLLCLLSSRACKASTAGLLRSFRHAPAAPVKPQRPPVTLRPPRQPSEEGKALRKTPPYNLFILLGQPSSLPTSSSLPPIINATHFLPFVPFVHVG